LACIIAQKSHLRLADRAADYQPGRRRAAAGPIPSVVDPQCRVIGATGLRVIDASIMPTVGPANTHLTTVMIAKKMADETRWQ
jgi:choline dehydrogenase-like flavoprotein